MPAVNKPVCLSNARPSKPIISSKFYLSKPACPRNISSSISIRSSDVCQSRSNAIPSKPVRPSDVCQVNLFVKVMLFQVNPFIQAMLV